MSLICSAEAGFPGPVYRDMGLDLLSGYYPYAP